MQEKACCFFGHHDTPEYVNEILYETVKSLINNGITKFYVGNHGDFDKFVIKTLRKLKEEYPNISYEIVLAYINNNNHLFANSYESIFPDGIEKVPKRYAIVWRNKWMLKHSDIVICYVFHHLGGAGQMYDRAITQNKHIINLYDYFRKQDN